MRNGEVRELTVEVLNVGQSPLEIAAVTTSCGCTSAFIDSETIAGGGRATLTIEYDSGAHGPGFAGEVERQIFIASNDPDQREVIITLNANVLAP